MDGVVFLVVQLPDGSPGTIRVDATDVLGMVAETASAVFDADGLHALHELVPAKGSAPVKTNRFDPPLLAPTKLGKVNLFACPENSR